MTLCIEMCRLDLLTIEINQNDRYWLQGTLSPCGVLPKHYFIAPFILLIHRQHWYHTGCLTNLKLKQCGVLIGVNFLSLELRRKS